jgi:hypothetical protein
MEKRLKKIENGKRTLYPPQFKDLCSSTTSCFRVSETSSPKIKSNALRKEWTEKA